MPLVDLPIALDTVNEIRVSHQELMNTAEGWAGFLKSTLETIRNQFGTPDMVLDWTPITIGTPPNWGADFADPEFGTTVAAEVEKLPDDSARQDAIGRVLGGDVIIGADVFRGMYDEAASDLAATYADAVVTAGNVSGMLGELPGEAMLARVDAASTEYRKGRQKVSLAMRVEQAKAWREDFWKAIDGFYAGTLAKAQALVATIQAHAIPVDAALRAELGRLQAEGQQLQLATASAEIGLRKGETDARLYIQNAQFAIEISRRALETIANIGANTMSAYLSAGGTSLHAGASVSESVSNSGSPD